MPRSHCTVIAVVFCALLAGAVLAAALDSQSGAYRRGINAAEYLAYPKLDRSPFFEGRRSATTQGDLKRLRRLGLSFIRLPVEPGPFLSASNEHRRGLERRLATFLGWAADEGLAVIVTGFARWDTPQWKTTDIVSGTNESARAAYLTFLKWLAAELGRRNKGEVALELMNEPQPECVAVYGEDWMTVQRVFYAEIRKVAPALKVVLTTGCWSDINGLDTLEMVGYDDNTLIDVHYYKPYVFTHQGATWSMAELNTLAGLAFPPDKTREDRATEASAKLALSRHSQDQRQQTESLRLALKQMSAYIKEDFGPEKIAADFDRAARWADDQGVERHRLIIGEFGALRPIPESGAADDGSRARWLATIRQAAETRGFGWALWALNASYGLFANGDDGAFDPAMVRALGLSGDAEKR